MSTYNLYDILTSTETQFKNNFTNANGYKVEPLMVVLGRPNAATVTETPFLAVLPYQSEVQSSYCDGGVDEDRRIKVLIMGFTKSLEDMCNMHDDVLKFLHSDHFSYPVDIFDEEENAFTIEQIANNIDIWIFDQTFTILYNQTY